MSLSLSFSGLTTAVNGFKCSTLPEHAHACEKAREIFLHLQPLENHSRHPHLVNSNKPTGTSEFYSNVGQRISFS